MIKPTLIIMAKAPIMGRAKTRLAKDIGTSHAKRIYRAMMSEVIRNTTDPRWNTVIAVTPVSMMGKVPEWRGQSQISQASGSLTPRLADVFKRKGKVVCIGTDCPDVTTNDIALAFTSIGRGRHVLGPADDGGFWLIGTLGPASSDLFQGVRWSHPDTLSDMEKRFEGRVVKLRTLIDVDDLKALRARRKLL